MPVKSTYPSPIPKPDFNAGRSSTVSNSSRIPAFKPREKTPTRAQSSPRASTPPPVNVSPTSSGRFVCGGCHKTVFQMERGVVPGPQGSKWHVGCLVCGGKDWKNKHIEAKRWGSDETEIGCGKKLDSQTRLDSLGRAYCRSCLVSGYSQSLFTVPNSKRFISYQNMLPDELRGSTSPTRAGPLVPTDTGSTSVYGRVNMNFAPPPLDDTSSVGAVGKLVTHFTGGGGPFGGYDSGSDSRSTSPYKQSQSRSASPVRRQITGGSGYLSRGLSTSPVKANITGGSGFGGRDFSNPLSPQMTGSGLPVTHSMRPHSVVGMARNFTGGSTSPLKPNITGGFGGGITPQTTGGGLPVTRPRPKSVMSTRSGRGMGLVRQITGGSDWTSRDI